MDHEHHHHMNMDNASPMGMDMGGDRCSMNMLFTWDPKNLCIIFRTWHVRGPVSLVLSLLAIVALTAGYEFVRDQARRYELSLANKPVPAINESSSLLPPTSGRNDGGSTDGGRSGHVVKALFYAVQVFYSFFIMLLFMTYNGWVMLAVAVGAFVGYLLWGNTPAAKSVACH